MNNIDEKMSLQRDHFGSNLMFGSIESLTKALQTMKVFRTKCDSLVPKKYVKYLRKSQKQERGLLIFLTDENLGLVEQIT